MSQGDSESVKLLRVIAANTTALVEAAPPKPRTWGWRLNNIVWLAVTLAGAVASAAAGWFFGRL